VLHANEFRALLSSVHSDSYLILLLFYQYLSFFLYNCHKALSAALQSQREREESNYACELSRHCYIVITEHDITYILSTSGLSYQRDVFCVHIQHGHGTCAARAIQEIMESGDLEEIKVGGIYCVILAHTPHVQIPY
jgi:hypothetical protein